MLRHKGWRNVLGKASGAKYALLLREIWKNGLSACLTDFLGSELPPLACLRPGGWTGRSPLPAFSQDDDRGEEWERHEALHEDVTGQERTTERLFEEEIELKWEKGGSGLVFYTDAQFWQEEEGGNAG